MNTQEKILFSISFFFSFCVALAAYVNASFLKETLSTTVVSYMYALTSICTLGILYFFEKIKHRYTIKKVLIFSLISAGFHALILFSKPVFGLTLYAFMIMQTSLVMTKISLDLLVETHKTNISEGKLRGAFLSITNMGWIFAAGLAGIIASIDPKYIYILNGFLYISLSAISYFLIAHTPKDLLPDSSLKEKILLIKKNKSTRKIITSEFLLQLFYSTMIVFSPLFLHEIHGFSYKQIGFIFSIMLIPFVLVQYPLGKLADKKYGEKEFLILGYLLMVISVIVFASVKKHSFFSAALILFVSRIGAATVEVMNDTYFYSVTKEYKKFINILKGMNPLATLIVGSFAMIFIKIGSYEFLFITLGVILGIVGFINLKDLADTK